MVLVCIAVPWAEHEVGREGLLRRVQVLLHLAPVRGQSAVGQVVQGEGELGPGQERRRCGLRLGLPLRRCL